MRFKTNLFLMFFAAIFLIGTQGFSQSKADCKGKHHSGKEGLENKIPDLTDQQKKDIEKIGLDMKKKSLPITNELREKRAHLNTLKTTEPIDQKAIDKEIEAIGKLRTDLAKLKEGTRIKVRNVLTDEQKIIFDSEVGKHKGKEKCGGKSKADCKHKCNH